MIDPGAFSNADYSGNDVQASSALIFLNINQKALN